MKRGAVGLRRQLIRRLAAIGSVVVLPFFGGAAPISGPSPEPSPKAKAAPRYRSLEQSLEFDTHPSTPDQQLAKGLESKADAEAEYIRGTILEDQGDDDGSLAAYTKSLQLDPGGNPALAVRVAHEYVKREDIASGISVLKDLAKARPMEPLAYLNLASFYLHQLKKPDLAARYAEQAVKVAPENFGGYQTLFELYEMQKRKPDAERVLQQANEANSRNPSFWLNLAGLFVKLYEPRTGDFPANRTGAVEAPLRKAVVFAGDDGSIYSRAADTYVQINEFAEAIPLYLKALDLNKASADDRYKLAQSFLKTGRRDDAIRTLEETLKVNPLRFEVYEFLARLYEDSGNADRALSNYQQALLLAPNQPENYLHAAEAQLQLKRYDDAIRTLEDARRRFPIPQITYSLAIALSTAKRHSEALPIYESALQEAKTTQEDLLDGGFYFNYAVSAEQAGLIDKAAALLKESIDRDPSKAAQAYNYLGFMWVDRNVNLDEGGEMIRRALDLEPENGAFLDSLGWFYYRKGEYGKALVELLHAADVLKPADPVVFDHVGDVYHALGNAPQAVVYWQKASNLDPKNQALLAKIDESKAKLTANPSPAPTLQPNPTPRPPGP
jgi:tetratricopeptide (TPR) repeat protein